MPTHLYHAGQHEYAADLAIFLANNPAVQAAWLDDHNHPTSLTVCTTVPATSLNLGAARRLHNLKLRIHAYQTFKTLEAPLGPIDCANPHQCCQDEPVNLGCQIQPQDAPWVGTAGAPVHWIDSNTKHHWGILSNWHVMAAGPVITNRRQHQPTEAFGPIAHLSAAAAVSPTEPNLVDAAIANAAVDGKHTIAEAILGLGPITAPSVDAAAGLTVQKAGRTTQVTQAICTAVGAAVRVGYGTFTATFLDQDIYTSTDEPFSAPGDSGSLICTVPVPGPVSLLFAGGGQLTIANPFRHVAKYFNLQHPFN